MNEGLRPEIKREIIKSIISKEFESGELPQGVFILSGGIIEKKGRLRTTSYSDVDPHGLVVGGKARVIAGAEIAKMFPEVKLVATSRYETDRPTHASIIAEELRRDKVNDDQIILEEESYSTYTELVEMVKISLKNKWRRVSVLTSDYHIPRVREFWRQLEVLSGGNDEFIESLHNFHGNSEVGFLSAEDVLENISGHYKYLIEKVRDSEPYKERLVAEQKGIEDLGSGKYILGIDPRQK